MKQLLLLLVVPMLSFITGNNEEKELVYPEEMKGVWLTHKKDAKVEIYEQNGIYYGKVIWARDRELPNQDVFILEDFKPKGKKLVGGKVFNPISGKSYKSIIKLKKNGKLKIKVMSGWLFKNIYWIRVQ